MNSLEELGKQFDEDYFKRGTQKRVSLYKDFRWQPHISFPIANTIKKLMKEHHAEESILDYGCAMGYIVYALRLLGVDAYGYEISPFALSRIIVSVAEYIYGEKEDVPTCATIFAKDVLEHIPYELIDDELSWISKYGRFFIFIIPLGSEGEYRIAEYGFDKTHIIIENEEWWIRKFISHGFRVKEFYHHLEGFKNNWYEHNQFGNGIFLLE